MTEKHTSVVNDRTFTQYDEEGTVDVAVMTVIPVELDAALSSLEGRIIRRDKDPATGTIYHYGHVFSELTQRNYRILLACIGGAGNPGAAAAANELLQKYQPRVLLLVGIAAGVRGKVKIGDVVLSERVVAYEPAALIRAADGGRTTQPRPEIERVSHRIAQDVVHYRQVPKRLRAAFLGTGGTFPKPPDAREEEFRKHVAKGVIARTATIASGEKLLRDPSTLIDLGKHVHGKTEVAEMEAAGIVEACRRYRTPWLVIRGISDFGDVLKDDQFHGFAARTATTVLVDFLAYGLDLGKERLSTEIPSARARLEVAPALQEPATPNACRPVFIFGRPLDRDEDFVGRRQEQGLIMRAIELGQPVQVLGENLMGKTSLLRWVQRHALPGRPIVCVDPTRGLTPVSMAAAIAEKLEKNVHVQRLRSRDVNGDDAANVLEAITPFVLIVDDADALALLGSGFTVNFFNGIRSLVQDRKMTWVSASKRNLYDLFKERGLTSAFLNDARKVWVGPIENEAARKIAQVAATARVPESAIVSHVGRFAYGLQWLGELLLNNDYNVEQAFDAFASEMESKFADWYDSLDLDDRQLLRTCASSIVLVNELDKTPRRRLRDLVTRGLLTEHGGRFVLEGEAWREFVCDAD